MHSTLNSMWCTYIQAPYTMKFPDTTYIRAEVIRLTFYALVYSEFLSRLSERSSNHRSDSLLQHMTTLLMQPVSLINDCSVGVYQLMCLK